MTVVGGGAAVLGVSVAPAAIDPANARPGWLALGLVVLLGIATYLLWRSMNRQLGKITVPRRGASPVDPPPLPDERASGDATGEPSAPDVGPPGGSREDVPRPLHPADGSDGLGDHPEHPDQR